MDNRNNREIIPKCIYLRIGKESKCSRADHKQESAELCEAAAMLQLARSGRHEEWVCTWRLDFYGNCFRSFALMSNIHNLLMDSSRQPVKPTSSQKGLTLAEPVFPQYPEKLANPGLERVSYCEWFGSGARAEARGHQKRRPASLGINVCGTQASFH